VSFSWVLLLQACLSYISEFLFNKNAFLFQSILLYSFDRLTLNYTKSSSPAVNVLAAQQEKMLHAAHSSIDENEQIGTMMA
jgi:hypothetical protein